MAETIKTYVSGGSDTIYTFEFEYISKDFVQVLVDGIEVGFTLTGTFQVTLDEAPEAGALIIIKRNTPASRIVDFVDGSILAAKDLNLSSLQAIHIAEEARDVASGSMVIDDTGTFNAASRRITNVGEPVSAEDVVTREWVENREDGFITQVDQSLAGVAGAVDAAEQAEQSAQLAITQANELVSEARQESALLVNDMDTVISSTETLQEGSVVLAKDTSRPFLVAPALTTDWMAETASGDKLISKSQFIFPEDFRRWGDASSHDTEMVRRWGNWGGINGGTMLARGEYLLDMSMGADPSDETGTSLICVYCPEIAVTGRNFDLFGSYFKVVGSGTGRREVSNWETIFPEFVGVRPDWHFSFGGVGEFGQVFRFAEPGQAVKANRLRVAGLTINATDAQRLCGGAVFDGTAFAKIDAPRTVDLHDEDRLHWITPGITLTDTYNYCENVRMHDHDNVGGVAWLSVPGTMTIHQKDHVDFKGNPQTAGTPTGANASRAREIIVNSKTAGKAGPYGYISLGGRYGGEYHGNRANGGQKGIMYFYGTARGHAIRETETEQNYAGTSSEFRVTGSQGAVVVAASDKVFDDTSVGKEITIEGAGIAGADHVTQIESVQSATEATLVGSLPEAASNADASMYVTAAIAGAQRKKLVMDSASASQAMLGGGGYLVRIKDRDGTELALENISDMDDESTIYVFNSIPQNTGSDVIVEILPTCGLVLEGNAGQNPPSIEEPVIIHGYKSVLDTGWLGNPITNGGRKVYSTPVEAVTFYSKEQDGETKSGYTLADGRTLLVPGKPISLSSVGTPWTELFSVEALTDLPDAFSVKVRSTDGQCFIAATIIKGSSPQVFVSAGGAGLGIQENLGAIEVQQTLSGTKDLTAFIEELPF